MSTRNQLRRTSTDEGGKGASIRCVPDWLNGFYGYLWNTFRGEQVRTNNFGKGSKFRITLEDCDFAGSPSKKSKRQENGLVLNRNGNLTVFAADAFGNSTEGNNVVFIPLTPDAGNPGTYSFAYTLPQDTSITSGIIIGEDGETYQELGTLETGRSNTTSFELESEDDGPVWFLGWTKSSDVKIEYDITAPKPRPSTATTTTTTTTTELSEATSTGTSTGTEALSAASINPSGATTATAKSQANSIIASQRLNFSILVAMGYLLWVCVEIMI